MQGAIRTHNELLKVLANVRTAKDEELERLRAMVATLADLLEETAANVDFQAQNQAQQDAENALRSRAAEMVAEARSYPTTRMV